MKTTVVRLSPLTEDWDDLTELLEDLKEYTNVGTSQLYSVVQALVEGNSTELPIDTDRIADFVAHMREFRIQASPSSR